MADEQIKVNKSELDEILKVQREMAEEIKNLKQDNAELQSNQQPVSGKVARKVTTKDIRIKFVDGKAVVGYRNRGVSEAKPIYTYEIPDPNDRTKRLLMVELLLAGEDKPVAVDYSSFINEGETRIFTVKSERKVPWVIEQGLIRRREVKDYSMIETDEMVPVETVGNRHYYTVEIDGKDVEIDERYVNIS
jgi:hypothetical protein